MKPRFLLAGVGRLLALMLTASLLGAMLLRFAPGFASDERELNSGLSASSIQAIRQARMADANIAKFYFHYFVSILRGDLGKSVSLNQPVRDLLRDRLPVTLLNLGLALLLAWALGLLLAFTAEATSSRLAALVGEGLSGTLISTPAAALALLFVLLRWPPWIAGALLVLPKIYRYSANLLREGYEQPHVLMARAKGAGASAILFRHVVPVALPQWIALLGISMSMAIGVMLPLEAICDLPGIGQLAWQAALARDLPLLINLTMVVTFLSVMATTLSDSVKRSLMRSAA
jgi:peptide/nickel transport system permease protein